MIGTIIILFLVGLLLKAALGLRLLVDRITQPSQFMSARQSPVAYSAMSSRRNEGRVGPHRIYALQGQWNTELSQSLQPIQSTEAATFFSIPLPLKGVKDGLRNPRNNRDAHCSHRGSQLWISRPHKGSIGQCMRRNNEQAPMLW